MRGNDKVEYAHLSNVFNALGSPTRLRILQLVGETKRPLHIKAVAEMLRMDYGAVYRHVDILKKVNLVQIFEVGRSRVLSPLHGDLLNQLLTTAMKMTSE